jgi:hypothetical protein
MSAKIAEVKSLHLGPGNEDMIVTAYVGAAGTLRRSGVQFNIGNKYCALSGDQVAKLIEILTARLNHEEGFCATGQDNENILFPNGEYHK